MRRIPLSEMLVGSIIPSMIVYLGRDVFNLTSRGFTAIEIVRCLAISLFFGIVCTFGFFAACRWVARTATRP